MTSRDIVLRLCSLCAVCGLAQVASASYLLIVLLSKNIVNRDAKDVDRNGGNASINLWNINTTVLFSGVIGLFVVLVMIFSRRAIAEVNFGGSLRFMWFLFWLIPLEIYVSINLFDYYRVSEVRKIQSKNLCEWLNEAQTVLYASSPGRFGSISGGSLRPWHGFGSTAVRMELTTHSVSFQLKDCQILTAKMSGASITTELILAPVSKVLRKR
jgi:hypothetical protein